MFQSKIIKFILIFLFFFSSITFAKSYKDSEIIEGKYQWTSKLQYELPKGKWIVLHDSFDSGACNLTSRYTILAKIENNLITDSIKFEILNSSIKCSWVVDHYIEDFVFSTDPDIDNCHNKGNYFYIKTKKNSKRGWAHNCLIVSHYNPSKSKKYWEAEDFALLNKIKKKYSISPIYLTSRHFFYSRSTIQKWFHIEYSSLPEKLTGPPSKPNENNSEYHVNNISNFPKHKLNMNKWLNIAKTRHIQLERFVKAKSDFKLNLLNANNNFINKNNNSNSVIEQLEKLNDLYKSGVLSKNEFNQAKKKILK